MAVPSVPAPTHSRRAIAAAGVLMQMALGAAYAWSVFRIPLTRSFRWTIFEVTLTFTIAIFVLGLAALGGGVWMRRAGGSSGRQWRSPMAPAHYVGGLAILGILLAFAPRSDS